MKFILLKDGHIWLVKNVTFGCQKIKYIFLPRKEWFWCTNLFLLSLITKIFYLNPWKCRSWFK